MSETKVISESDCGTLITKGNDFNIEQNIEIPNTISAPIKKGEIIGKLTYVLNGEKVGECNLAVNEDIDKICFIGMEKFVLNKWFTLLR